MARYPLIGGAYATRSVIASAQRRINYFPELNPKFALTPVTHYQRPGLVPIANVGTGPIRCLWRTSRAGGISYSTTQYPPGFVVSGSEVFQINSDWSFTKLGNVSPNKTNICSIVDNGLQGMVVDGSPSGWYWNLVPTPTQMVEFPNNPTQYAQIEDPTGLWEGADKLDYIDTFILFNIPGTNLFGSTLSNQIVPFDGTYYAAKTDYPDLLVSLVVNRHEFLLMGQLKSETWYDAGNALFPFAELPGSFIEHGVAAKYSPATQDISTFWLAQNLQGTGMVMRYRGYITTRVSNHAVEFAIREMAATVGISDAIGYTYQQDGHVFYVLHFPAGDQTWVYDDSMGDPANAWHQQAWTDSNGNLHRHRGNCYAFINGENVVGDWENNTIYKMDLNRYSDTVNGVKTPLTCICTFPQIGGAMGPNGQMMEYDGKRMQINAFLADFEGGGGIGSEAAGEEQNFISLRMSRDRGKTWGNPVVQDAGVQGDYTAQPVWRINGIERYPVFELSHSIEGPAALNGAWVEAKLLGT